MRAAWLRKSPLCCIISLFLSSFSLLSQVDRFTGMSASTVHCGWAHGLPLWPKPAPLRPSFPRDSGSKPEKVFQRCFALNRQSYTSLLFALIPFRERCPRAFPKCFPTDPPVSCSADMQVTRVRHELKHFRWRRPPDHPRHPHPHWQAGIGFRPLRYLWACWWWMSARLTRTSARGLRADASAG